MKIYTPFCDIPGYTIQVIGVFHTCRSVASRHNRDPRWYVSKLLSLHHSCTPVYVKVDTRILKCIHWGYLTIRFPRRYPRCYPSVYLLCFWYILDLCVLYFSNSLFSLNWQVNWLSEAHLVTLFHCNWCQFSPRRPSTLKGYIILTLIVECIYRAWQVGPKFKVL